MNCSLDDIKIMLADLAIENRILKRQLEAAQKANDDLKKTVNELVCSKPVAVDTNE